MIITRTPFRISFFGGGTDYPVYYKEHGGSVLSTTINKYCYITCRYLPPFFEHKYLIRYSKNEVIQSIEEIQHPSVRECLKFVGIEKGIEMVHTADVPAMSGIGSSSSFTVGFLNAIYALQGKMVTKRKLALDAIYVEQELIKEHVGSQDQVAASFGGFNKIDFGGNEEIFVQPITITEEKLQYLQDRLLFYFTGFARFSSDIAKEQIKQTPKKITELSHMKEMVDESIRILNGRAENIDNFGKLLHESWKLKRSLTSKITNDKIDEIYEAGIRSGATGGKICGAGGGGFILFFVPPEKKIDLKKKLKNFLNVPFRFENIGTHVVHYSM
ncbi:MAG: kinase [Desulfobacterales bacterium]|nr:kinase [Desulfobacterales bacterium]